MAYFGAKLQSGKNNQKIILAPQKSCFMKKRDRKNTKYSRNEEISKSGKNGHFAKPIVSQNGPSFGEH